MVCRDFRQPLHGEEAQGSHFREMTPEVSKDDLAYRRNHGCAWGHWGSMNRASSARGPSAAPGSAPASASGGRSSSSSRGSFMLERSVHPVLASRVHSCEERKSDNVPNALMEPWMRPRAHPDVAALQHSRCWESIVTTELALDCKPCWLDDLTLMKHVNASGPNGEATAALPGLHQRKAVGCGKAVEYQPPKDFSRAAVTWGRPHSREHLLHCVGMRWRMGGDQGGEGLHEDLAGVWGLTSELEDSAKLDSVGGQGGRAAANRPPQAG